MSAIRPYGPVGLAGAQQVDRANRTRCSSFRRARAAADQHQFRRDHAILPTNSAIEQLSACPSSQQHRRCGTGFQAGRIFVPVPRVRSSFLRVTPRRERIVLTRSPNTTRNGSLASIAAVVSVTTRPSVPVVDAF
jgi:hypothetical protein